MKLFLAVTFFSYLVAASFAQTAAVRCDGASAASAEAPLSSEISLKTMEGKSARLSDFRGKPLILNFWATWCPPCQRELPWLAAIHKKFEGRGLRVAGISMDDFDNPLVREVTSQANVTYPLLFGSLENALELVGTQGIPVTLFIDANGKILHKSVGIANQEELETHALELLRGEHR